MTEDKRKNFTVIVNNELEEVKNSNIKEKHRTYQTNPLTEKLMKFTNNEAGPKFSIKDLLR